MALTLRTVSNTGSPLYYPDGSPIVGAEIRFQLVDAFGTPTDTFDATTGERVTGFNAVETNASGVFSVNLWPNDRGIASTQYRCTVSTPMGVQDILATVPSGVGTWTWLQFVTAGAIVGPSLIPTVEYLVHKDASNGYVGLTGFDIDFYNAAGTFKSLLHNTNTAAWTYTFQDRTGTIADLGANIFTAAQTAPQFISNIATGTAPLVVASTTPVANLYATGLAGGAAGSLPYQTAANTTGMLALGTLGYVMTAGATAPQWSRPGTYGTIGQPNIVVTVGAQNCNYTTIQAALTANPTVNLLVMVFPGTYANDTINFTANGQCVIGVGTAPQQVVTQASTTVCVVGAFTGCRLENLTLTVTAATTAVGCITVSTGSLLTTECFLNCTNSTVTTASQPFLTNVTGAGTLEVEEGEQVYTNTVSDTTGATAIKAAHIVGTGGLLLVERCDIVIVGGGLSLGVTPFYSPSTGSFTPLENEVSIVDTAASFIAGYFSAGTGTLTELHSNTFHMTGGAATSVVGIWLSSTATVTSHFNHYLCTGGATNYYANLAAGSTVNSFHDAIQAASGKTGAGTFNAVDWSTLIAPIGSVTPADIYETNTPSLSAAGATQGTATQLIAQWNKITAATLLQGVILQVPLRSGLLVGVDNDTAVDIYVYPAVGGQIDVLGVNAPIRIPAGGSAMFLSASTTQWDTYLSPNQVFSVVTATTGIQSGSGTAAANTPFAFKNTYAGAYHSYIWNLDTGTTAQAGYSILNDAGNQAYIVMTGSGYTPSGVLAARQLIIQNGAGATGGILVSALSTNPVDFATNSTRAGRISGAQNWLFGSGTTDTGNAAIQVGAGTTAKAPLQLTSGANLTTAAAGCLEYDGASVYETLDTSSGRGQIPVRQHFHLTAAGGAITTIANFFGATSNISLVANAYYEIEIVCYFLKTTADTVVWTLTNSAAPTGQNIEFEMSPVTGIVAPPGTATLLAGQVYNDTTAAYTVTTGVLTTGVNHYARFKIQLKNGAGTSLKIQATSTTGSVTPGIGSYWTCTRLPAGNTGTFAA